MANRKVSGKRNKSVFFNAIGRSFEMYKKHFLIIISLSLIAAFFQIMNELINIDNLIITIVLFLLSSIVDSVISIIIILFIASKISKKNTSMRKILTEAFGLLLPYIFISFLYSANSFGWSGLFIIPGILFQGYYFLAATIFVVEKESILNAFKKSYNLIKNYFNDVLLISLLIVFFVLGMYCIIQIGLKINYLNSILQVFINPLTIIVAPTLYYSLLKINKPSYNKWKTFNTGKLVAILIFGVILSVGMLPKLLKFVNLLSK